MFSVDFDFLHSGVTVQEASLSMALNNAVEKAVCSTMDSLIGFKYPDKYAIYRLLHNLEDSNEDVWGYVSDSALWQGVQLDLYTERGEACSTFEEWSKCKGERLHRITWSSIMTLSVYYYPERGEYNWRYADSLREIDIFAQDFELLLQDLKMWAFAQALNKICKPGNDMHIGV